MVTQPQFVFYVTTPEKRRPVHIMGGNFKFITSRKEHFFGMINHWVTKQEQVRISDLEKTIIDSLCRPENCGGITEAAKGIWMRRQDVNLDRLIEYALKMNIGAVIRRLGYLLELYAICSPELLETLRSHLTETYSRIDPILPPEGKFIRKWRLQLNVSPDELLSAVST